MAAATQRLSIRQIERLATITQLNDVIGIQSRLSSRLAHVGL
jgi:hypothetical protein